MLSGNFELILTMCKTGQHFGVLLFPCVPLSALSRAPPNMLEALIRRRSLFYPIIN